MFGSVKSEDEELL